MIAKSFLFLALLTACVHSSAQANSATPASTTAQASPTGPPVASLEAIQNQADLDKAINALDAALFDAYNRCDLEKFSTFFVDDVEFYHDQGGVTLGKDKLTKSIKDNICGGDVRRELVPGTMQAHYMKGYGAVEIGVHRFYHPQIEHAAGRGQVHSSLAIQRRRVENYSRDQLRPSRRPDKIGRMPGRLSGRALPPVRKLPRAPGEALAPAHCGSAKRRARIPFQPPASVPASLTDRRARWAAGDSP